MREATVPATAVRVRWAKGLILAASILAILWPWIVGAWSLSAFKSGIIPESSIYGFNRTAFFWDLLHLRSFFEEGQHAPWVLQYAWWYAAENALSSFLPDATAYVTLVGICFGFAQYGLVRLLLQFGPDDDDGIAAWAIACLFGVLYLSSLAMFNFIQNNIFFALPYLVLPLLLLWSLRYAFCGDRSALVPFVLVGFTTSDLNIFHDVIVFAAINVFVAVYSRTRAVPAGRWLPRLALLNALLLPGLIWLLTATIGHITYLGPLSDFTKVSAEGMYSNNAAFLNILLQQTDWGLFDNWNGNPYYSFAWFYRIVQLWPFGFAPFFLFGFGALAAGGRHSAWRIAAPFALLAALLILTMFGNDNIVYHLLYVHFVPFQIFRNITKLAPLLYLLLLVGAFVLIRERIRVRGVVVAALAIAACGLLYNIPYWAVGAKTLDLRTVRHVPSYWRAAGAFLRSRMRPYDQALAVPATYIYETYDWQGKRTAIQGDILDILLTSDVFRLSERLVGPAQYQFDANATFLPSNRSIRKLDTSYVALTGLVRKYHLDYVVVSHDMVSEYQHMADVEAWLRVAGYRRVAEYGPVEIYFNPAYRVPTITGTAVRLRRVNALRYDLDFAHVTDRTTLVFHQPFHAGWEARILPFAESPCRISVRQRAAHGYEYDECAPSPTGGSVAEELRAFFDRSARVLGDHVQTPDGENAWSLDAATLRRTLPRAFYRVNADGSLALRVELLFRPQAITYLGLIVSLALGAIALALAIVMALTDRDESRLRRLTVTAAALLVCAVAVGSLDAVARSENPRDSGGPRGVSLGRRVHARIGGHPLRVSFAVPVRGNLAVGVSPCENGDAAPDVKAHVRSGILVAELTAHVPGDCALTLSLHDVGSGTPRARIFLDVVSYLPLSLNPQIAQTREALDFASTDAKPVGVPLYQGRYGDWLSTRGCNGIANAALTPRPQGSLAPITSMVTIRALRSGSCMLDVHERDGDVYLAIRVAGSLSFVHAPAGGTVMFRGPNAPDRLLELQKRSAFEPLRLGLINSSCATVAGIYIEPGTLVNGTAGAKIDVHPVAPGHCSVVIGDEYGDDDRSAVLDIVVRPLAAN